MTAAKASTSRSRSAPRKARKSSASRKVAPALTRDRSPFELALLGAAVLAICLIIVGLVASGLKQAPARADLHATVVSIGPASGGVAYRVTVENRGRHTAENVVVEVAVGEETREANIAAVARRDQEHATVVFPLGTSGEATATVQSYSEPAR